MYSSLENGRCQHIHHRQHRHQHQLQELRLWLGQHHKTLNGKFMFLLYLNDRKQLVLLFRHFLQHYLLLETQSNVSYNVGSYPHYYSDKGV